MPSVNRREVRFVRALLPGQEARCGADELFRADAAGRVVTLSRQAVGALISAGVLLGDGVACRPSREAMNWLRRQLAEVDPHASQHRHEVRTADGRRLNLTESPLARLATCLAGETEPFLAPHQVEAGERLRRLVARAQLQPRVTMSYDAAQTASGGGGGALEVSDMAADARRGLAQIARAMPRDCADVVFDVCGLEKGLQVIESERGWPRRSAKLVLRIGLDQLARHFGLAPEAFGRDVRRERAWMEGARPKLFGDD